MVAACGSGADRVGVVAFQAAAPAAPAARAWEDSLHGVAIPDHWRWLEDTTDVSVRAWMEAEQTYARAVLDETVGGDSIAARIERMFASLSTLGDVRESQGGRFATRWLGSTPSLMAITAGDSTERLLLSDAALAAAREGARIRAFVPSFDGRFVALGTTREGDLAPSVSIVQVGRGVLLPDRIPDLLSTTSGTRYEVTWLPDGSGFIYPREWPGAASGPASERLSRGRQFVHRLGTSQTEDVPLFGFDVSPDVPAEPTDLPTRVYTAPNSDWIVGAYSRVQENGAEFFAARLRPDARGRISTTRWQRIGAVDDKLREIHIHGDTVYAISRRVDRGALVRLVLRDTMPADRPWEIVLAEGEGVLTAIAVQQNAIYLTERQGGAERLLRLRPSDSAATPVVLPFPGGIDLLPGAGATLGVAFSISTWSATPRYFRLDDAAETPSPLGIDDGAGAMSASVVSERLEAQSADGTMVPISLVYDSAALASGVLDGSASLLIETYGGFGASTDPGFAPHVNTWVALGGVYAFAHVRGGGELGDAWHRAAMRDGKQRTIDDMIAAIEMLVDRRYTSTGRVVLSGFSFGAHVPGLLVAQRPDLLGAIHFGAGQPDELRGASFDPTSARNLTELGDVNTAQGVRLLLNSSPYHQVPRQLTLPAVIVHSARADYNFGTEMLAGKYVARLRSANNGPRPVLWVRTEGGHVPLFDGEPSLAGQTFAFLLWQTGDPRYQPR